MAMQPDPWKIVAGLAVFSAVSALIFRRQKPIRDGNWHRVGSEMGRFVGGRWEYRPITAAEISGRAERE